MFGKRKKRREAIRNKLREKSEYKMKSENVAIPEIHTKDFDEIEEHIDEIEQEKEEKYKIQKKVCNCTCDNSGYCWDFISWKN